MGAILAPEVLDTVICQGQASFPLLTRNSTLGLEPGPSRFLPRVLVHSGSSAWQARLPSASPVLMASLWGVSLSQDPLPLPTGPRRPAHCLPKISS